MNSGQPVRGTDKGTLESWKEIAEYLQRNTTTARRWEREEGLPVHRHSHTSRSSVYAYPSEIDAWRVSRKVVADSPPARSLWRLPAYAVTMLLCLIMIGNGIRPVAAQQARQSARQVWTGPKVDTYGNVSPDGRYISHVDWSTGALVLRDLVTDTEREIVHNPNYDDNAEESAISKDGRLVAYSWSNDQTKRYELRLANITGDANPRRLYDNQDIDWIAPYDWSPDNRSVVVEIKRKDQTAQIGVVSVPEGALRVLKSVEWRGTGRIFFSPDGRFVGYDLPISDTNRQHNVFILAVDGSRETPAVTHPSMNFMMGWSPDGKNLLFASDRKGSMGLWSVAIADGRPQSAPELIRRDIGWPEPMGVTRAGALYYSLATLGGDGSHIQVAAFDFDPGKLVSPPADVPHAHGESTSQPAWSPDGKYLAYILDRGRLGSSNAQNNGEHLRDLSLVIRPAETGQAVHELPLRMIRAVRLMRWAPDGRSLFTSGADFKGRQGIFQVDTQTGEMRPMALNLPPWHRRVPVLSPDAKTLYYVRTLVEDRGYAIIKRDLASGTENEIFRNRSLGWVNLSPDGQWIATPGVDPSTNSRTMLLIPVVGGAARAVIQVPSGVDPGNLINTRKGQSFSFVGWAPDGKSMLVRKHLGEGNGIEIWRVPITEAAPRKLSLSLPNGSGETALHPDGKRIAFTISETQTLHTSEVWALENFLPPPSAKK